MNYRILILLVSLGVSRVIMAQEPCLEKYTTLDPGGIPDGNAAVQQYDVVLKWQNLDAINGTVFNCNAVSAVYHTGLENEQVAWKDVHLAQLSEIQEDPSEGTLLPDFEGFSYRMFDTAFLEEDFYDDLPASQRDLAKWLVSDAIQMHGMAIYYFDSLRYNIKFVPEMLSGYPVEFENWVTFSSRYQEMVWNGLAIHSGEVCAEVAFHSLYNPVIIDNEQMTVKGRSLYYGEMWISLSDKQVERATMVEDVVMKLTSDAFPGEQLINLQREITFSKR